jgi:hypothetical protein
MRQAGKLRGRGAGIASERRQYADIDRVETAILLLEAKWSFHRLISRK